MHNRLILAYLLLLAMLATALPETTWCLGDDRGDRQPADKPVKESEEKEEASGKAEIEDGDDFEAFAVGADANGWSCRTWAKLDFEISLFRRVHQHGPDHCRAPPASLI